MGVYLIERYTVGLTPEALRGAGDRVTSTGGATYLGSVLVPTDEGALCLFLADSLAALQRAAEQEGTPFERIVAAQTVAPTAPPESPPAQDLEH